MRVTCNTAFPPQNVLGQQRQKQLHRSLALALLRTKLFRICMNSYCFLRNPETLYSATKVLPEESLKMYINWITSSVCLELHSKSWLLKALCSPCFGYAGYWTNICLELMRKSTEKGILDILVKSWTFSVNWFTKEKMLPDKIDQYASSKEKSQLTLQQNFISTVTWNNNE